MPPCIVAIELDRTAGGLQGLIVPPSPQERRGEIRLMSQWIKFLGSLLQRDGLVVPSQDRAQAPVKVIRIRAARTQLECPLELRLGAGPVEVIHELAVGNRAMRFSEFRVERE